MKKVFTCLKKNIIFAVKPNTHIHKLVHLMLIKWPSNSRAITLHKPVWTQCHCLTVKKRKEKETTIPTCWTISSANICYGVWQKKKHTQKKAERGRQLIQACRSLAHMCDVWSVIAQACATHTIMGSLLLSHSNAKLWTMTITLSQVSFIKYGHFCFKERKKKREEEIMGFCSFTEAHLSVATRARGLFTAEDKNAFQRSQGSYKLCLIT